LLVGVLYDNAHTRDMNAFGGLGIRVPVLAGFMIFASFASLGLPLLSGFVGEFLCFLAAFQAPHLKVLTGISLLGILFTAGFFLIFIRKVFLGPLNPKWETLPDMNARQLLTTIPLILLMIVLGLFPGIVLGPMNNTVIHLFDLLSVP
jgi:NADH-quinone oxidoreductase subunit M